MTRKLILIADADSAALKELGNAFHERDYEVRAARDGSKALEKAIIFHPDLILFDIDCPLIPPRKFIQIIRSNPRTEDIPVVIMGRGDAEEISLWGYREAVVRKPFNTDEVLSLIGAIFRKMATAREVREGGQEIAGSLAQISLVDLLQIFSLNRKTGLLEVNAQDLQGQIYVLDGNVIHAGTGRHRGEKALFRMLQWREGSFAFIPEKGPTDQNIRRSTDTLLLEGARQADEMARLRAELPADNIRLQAVPERVGRYEGLHPVTQEIVNLLEFYNSVGELIEHTRVSDFEACRAIRTLLGKGVLQAVADESREQPKEEQPLLGHDQLYGLKVALSAGLPPQARLTHGKICLIGPDDRFLKEVLNALRKLPGVELSGQLEGLRRGFGLLGALHLSENLLLELVLLPEDPMLRPLWEPLGVAASGVLILRSTAEEQHRYRGEDLAYTLSRGKMIPMLMLSAEDLGHLRLVLVCLLEQMAAVLSSRKTSN